MRGLVVGLGAAFVALALLAAPASADVTIGSTAQRVQCNLLLLLGEYFLDTTAGTPWIQPDSTGIEPILGKMPANVAYASAQVKKTILATEGVKSITAFDLTFNRTTRNVTMTARGIDDDGDTFNVSVSTANLFST